MHALVYANQFSLPVFVQDAPPLLRVDVTERISQTTAGVFVRPEVRKCFWGYAMQQYVVGDSLCDGAHQTMRLILLDDDVHLPSDAVEQSISSAEGRRDVAGMCLSRIVLQHDGGHTRAGDASGGGPSFGRLDGVALRIGSKIVEDEAVPLGGTTVCLGFLYHTPRPFSCTYFVCCRRRSLRGGGVSQAGRLLVLALQLQQQQLIVKWTWRLLGPVERVRRIVHPLLLHGPRSGRCQLRRRARHDRVLQLVEARTARANARLVSDGCLAHRFTRPPRRADARLVTASSSSAT